MGLTALSLIGTIIVLNVFHHCPEKPVPKWLKNLVLQRVAKCLCMTDRKDTGITLVQPINETTIDSKETNDVKIENLNGYSATKNGIPNNPPNTMYLPPEIRDYFRQVKEREAEGERLEKNSEEWGRLSRVIDRVFFVLFAIILVVVGVLMVVMIRDNSMKDNA